VRELSLNGTDQLPRFARQELNARAGKNSFVAAVIFFLISLLFLPLAGELRRETSRVMA